MCYKHKYARSVTCPDGALRFHPDGSCFNSQNRLSKSKTNFILAYMEADSSRFRSYNYQTTAHLGTNIMSWQGVYRQGSNPLQSNCTGYLPSPPTNQVIWMLISQARKVYSGKFQTKIKLKSPTSRRKSDDVGNTKPKPHR